VENVYWVITFPFLFALFHSLAVTSNERRSFSPCLNILREFVNIIGSILICLARITFPAPTPDLLFSLSPPSPTRKGLWQLAWNSHATQIARLYANEFFRKTPKMSRARSSVYTRRAATKEDNKSAKCTRVRQTLN
jgi:hypothetical protein